MNYTIAVLPTAEQMQALMSGPADQAVVMLNLLRFKRNAEPPNEGLSGEAAYRRYLKELEPLMRWVGARVLWFGRVDSQVLGSGAETFEAVLLAEYPSRKAFAQMVTDERYVHEIGVHRASGLEGQWLLAMTPTPA